MDNRSLCGTSVSEGKNSETICNSTSLGDHNSMDKVSACLSGMPQINGVNGMNNTNDVQKRLRQGYYIKEDEEEEEEEDEEEEDDFSEEVLLAQMGYAESESKRKIIKEPEKQYYDKDEGEEEDDLSEESSPAQMGYLKSEPPKHDQITTAMAALNLVSAFKGSRVKGGKPAKECRVSWAPDVYDHFALSKTERHKSEQMVRNAAGKNRQKDLGKGVGASEGGGKGSRGGGGKGSVGGGGKAAGKGKDKKQVKKYGRSASKYSNYDE